MTSHPLFLAAHPRAVAVATAEVRGGPKLMASHGCAAPLTLEEEAPMSLLLSEEVASPLRLGAGKEPPCCCSMSHHVCLH